MADKNRAALPEPTITAWSATTPPSATVLDIAAGSGRHATLFARRGCAVTAVDRDVAALRSLDDDRIEVVEADLEGAQWPFGDRRWDVIVVTNYLWRPLLGHLAAALGDAGALMYETFMAGNERFGRPRHPRLPASTGRAVGVRRGQRPRSRRILRRRSRRSAARGEAAPTRPTAARRVARAHTSSRRATRRACSQRGGRRRRA